MPSIWETVRPQAVPRCPERHSPFRAGCKPCQDRACYQRKLGIWERANGVDRAYHPVEPTRDHLIFLTTGGNRTVPDIAAESGVSDAAIRAIMAGKRRRLLPLTVKSLRAVEAAAAPQPDPHFSHLVPAVEGVRILRGLFAQGWCWPHIGGQLGGVTGGAAQQMARAERKWMLPETRDRIRALAHTLGRYDIHELPAKLPGMDIRCANRAAKNGWHKLGEWDGLDIVDPDADPSAPPATVHLIADLDDDEPAVTLPYVDSVIAPLVRLAAERIAVTTPNLSRRTEGFIDPIGNLTRLEMHVATHLASIYGMALTQTAVLLGYPHTTNEEIGNAQRIVSRVNVIAAQAYAAIEHHPTGWTPSWFPFGRFVGFASRLPGLIALLPEPYGFGWTLADFVERLGITEDEARQFLARAVPAGDAAWTPPRRNAIPTGQLVAA